MLESEITAGLSPKQVAELKRLSKDIEIFKRSAKRVGKPLEYYLTSLKMDPKMAAAIARISDEDDLARIMQQYNASEETESSKRNSWNLVMERLSAINIIKGLDRIALVLAIIATVPGFMIGAEFTFKKYHDRSLSEVLTGGAISSLLFFAVVLLGLRVTTRGIKWLSMWIADGFRDDGKDT